MDAGWRACLPSRRDKEADPTVLLSLLVAYLYDYFASESRIQRYWHIFSSASCGIILKMAACFDDELSFLICNWSPPIWHSRLLHHLHHVVAFRVG